MRTQEGVHNFCCTVVEKRFSYITMGYSINIFVAKEESPSRPLFTYRVYRRKLRDKLAASDVAELLGLSCRDRLFLGCL